MLTPDKTKYLAAMEATTLGPLTSEQRESAREKQFWDRVLSSSPQAEDVRDPFCSSWRRGRVVHTGYTSQWWWLVLTTSRQNNHLLDLVNNMLSYKKGKFAC